MKQMKSNVETKILNITNVKYLKYFLFLFLYFLSPEIFAGVFDVPPTD